MALNPRRWNILCILVALLWDEDTRMVKDTVRSMKTAAVTF
jgi:hypothetical protein